MSDFSLSDALADGVERAHKETKVLCDWLPDPPMCAECGRYMDAEHEYVDQQAMYMDVWSCPECDYREYRDES